jgi:hypothetical protein
VFRMTLTKICVWNEVDCSAAPPVCPLWETTLLLLCHYGSGGGGTEGGSGSGGRGKVQKRLHGSDYAFPRSPVWEYLKVGACEWVGLRNWFLLAVFRTSFTSLSSPDGVEIEATRTPQRGKHTCLKEEDLLRWLSTNKSVHVSGWG